ncbi:glutaredoxin-like protein NrdH (plasmid) [Arthrobacter sp. TMP15]|uniref:glutaredoxin-like protein NrdH n=1 Tax=Arthrobacter sp. TMP15 TaxID=3140789 RepID=UPI0031BA7317
MEAMVTVYSKPACVQCNATYRALDSAGISYVIVDLAQAPGALEYITEDLGYSQAPVVIVNDDDENHWSGFRPDKIEKLSHSSNNV